MQSASEQSGPVDHDQVALAAYLAWEKAGRPPGRDQEFWHDAETRARAAAASAKARAAARPKPRIVKPKALPKAEASPSGWQLPVLPRHRQVRPAGKLITGF